MRTRDIATEAWRNIASGASRPLLLFSLFALTLLLGVSFSAQLTASAMQRYATYDTSGAATTVIQAPASIDARRCTALDRVQGVTAAAALRQLPSEIRLAALPRFGQPQIEVFGDLFGLLGGKNTGTSGVFLSEGFASQLGLHAGDPLALTDTTTRLAGVFEFPEDGRLQLLANAVVSPTPDATAPFDECWVRVWPPNAQLTSLFDSVVLSGTQSAAAEFKLLNGTLGDPQSLSDLLADSHVAAIEAAGAGGALLLGFVVIRIRRLDLAVALHVGQSRMAQLAQILIEVAPIGLAAAVMVGVGTVAGVSVLVPEVGVVSIAHGAVVTGSALLGCLLAGVVVSHATIRAAKFGDWAKDR